MSTLSKTPLIPTSDEPLRTLDADAMHAAVRRGLEQRSVFMAELIAEGVAFIVRLVRGGWAAYTAVRAKRRAFDELMSLDHHMLSDIGVDRGEVHAIVYGEGLKDTAREAHKGTWTGAARPAHA